MWTVPLSEEQLTYLESESKLRQYTSAGSAPLLSSYCWVPVSVSHSLTNVPCNNYNDFESLLYLMRLRSMSRQYWERVQQLKINARRLAKSLNLCQSGQFSLGPLFSLGPPTHTLLSRETPHICPWGSNKSQLLPLVSNSENCIRRFFTQALLLS
jgi:hypothetical protein